MVLKQAAGTIVECNWKILVLRRASQDEHQPGTLGLPSGGIEEG